jgi:phosphoesterase RecJ-like protein
MSADATSVARQRYPHTEDESLDTADLRMDTLRLIDAIRGATHITAICHENPDADTVGAAIAIALMGRRLGIETEVVSVDGVPGTCAFLPLADDVRRRPALAPGLAVICDAASFERVGRITSEERAWLAQATLVNIDHHVTNSRWGEINLVDMNAAATCQIVAELLPGLAIQPDPEIGTALLAGIVRDSQGFADGATSPRTLEVAAHMMEGGASLASVHRHILQELPFPTLALWGLMLADVDQRLDGRIVHTTLLPAMLARTGTEQDDADGVAEFLARVRGVQVSLLFRELGPRATRVSVRTAEGVDAIAIAQPFGGGGHVRRAGFIFEGPVDSTRTSVLARCEALLADGREQ